MEIAALKAEMRTRTGTKYTRRLRETGRLPGIIYGHGMSPEPISVSAHDMLVHLQHGARVLNVALDGQAKQCLIKEVQYDHLQKDPIHFDLARVDLDERIRVDVAIELRGTPKGIGDGGILEPLKVSLSIECLAIEIPDTLRPSVAHLGIGDALLVKDLDVPTGVTTLDDPEAKIAIVRRLAVQAEAEEVEEESGPAEPERIGRVAETATQDTESKT